MTADPLVNLWTDPAWSDRYLRERDGIPHRLEGFAVLAELLPARVERILDLGTGDGFTLGLVLQLRPGATGVGLDFQPAMLERARARFADRDDVVLAEHDLAEPLPEDLGRFDAVVSSFAIHHLVDEAKRARYAEVFERLEPGGLFANLEHVASPTAGLHDEFLAAIGKDRAEDDPSNRLASVEAQCGWLAEIGFVDVDCFWKWRELALLAGRRPA